MSTPDVLAGLPDDARLWVFGTDRPLSTREEEHLLGGVDAFLEGWKAHGRPLSAGRSWRYGRFLLVGVDESVAPPTGCSIDALVRTLKEAEAVLGVRILEKDPVWYRDAADGEIRRVSRAEFRERGARGEIGVDTVVFDPALTRMAELRSGKWERPAGAGWHRRLLPADHGAAEAGGS
jgi:hypothetical protein